MIKKIAGFALVVAILTSSAMAAPAKSPQTYKAAPALAVEILIEHGENPEGQIIKEVSSKLGPRGTFMGLEKDDPHYKHAVMHYLHHTIGAIEMEQKDCENVEMN
ncbi:hypothetical protein [Alkalibacter saccharofermentans]|uniref:Uncharacterized protein n=1 Tax=Alkalibacter saccharofermentans DSM 14828 TaxID=1120975 RepID=A0A1M4UTA3_9FIRM|nr:hypothetical protein [Alkalibacter saccharofermentans]SHE59914.1 hypothetical protein SAMN02746064_00818 [Alkalibacter saccharofermentans DSM 14828]